MAEPSASVMPRRSRFGDEWPGSGSTDMADARWSKPAISRVKRINGGRLTSRTFGAQQNEVALHIKIANRNILLARPQSQRIR